MKGFKTKPHQIDLPVFRATLKEYRDIRNENMSKKLEERFQKFERKLDLHPNRIFIYEITDLPKNKPLEMDLYFILHGDFVKIGQAIDPHKRLKELQTGAPEKLKILAIIPKKGGMEGFCHKKLKHLHSRGEWFKYTDEINAFIEEIRGEMP